MEAAGCVFADVNHPWNGAIHVNLETAAVAGSRVERFQKHPLAGLGLEVVGAEILHALVHLVETPHLRLLVQQANDGAERHGEKAEEHVDELLVGLCEEHLPPLLVHEQFHANGRRFILSHGGLVVIWIDEVVWFLRVLHETCYCDPLKYLVAGAACALC